MKICAVCGNPVDLDVAHWIHEPECPNRAYMQLPCLCNTWVHPECCPECNAPGNI